MNDDKHDSRPDQTPRGDAGGAYELLPMKRKGDFGGNCAKNDMLGTGHDPTFKRSPDKIS